MTIHRDDRRPDAGDGTESTESGAASGDPRALYDALRGEISRVVVGNDAVIEHLTIALLTRGHTLLEGVPGVAKTTLANLFARTAGLEYSRIQMTPDVLPADVTGTHVYRENTGEFDLQRGPVFANLVVADEINRATPKAQSALLEAMEERQVTIEGETLELPRPFVVVATQNPIEMEGVYELPEAQRDRFQFKLTMDAPRRPDERALLDRFDDDPSLGLETVGQVVEVEDVRRARAAVSDVHVAPAVKEYVLDIVGATRTNADVAHGASPRATLAFLAAGKARAAIRDRRYVIPDDVKALCEPILTHRLVLHTDAALGDVTGAEVVEDVRSTVEPPSADVEEPVAADDSDDASGASGTTERVD